MSGITIYRDRSEGGRCLAKALESYRNRPETIVIGLARGGVVTASVVAKELNLPLDVICPRKIGAPSNPEYAIGAVTESGQAILHSDAVRGVGVDEGELKALIAKEVAVACKRVELYRGGRPQLDLRGMNVILVDDGIATGSTMEAAIESVRERGGRSIVVAVPVAPKTTCKELSSRVDAVISPLVVENFYAVGQFYGEFYQTSDDEVCQLLEEAYQR